MYRFMWIVLLLVSALLASCSGRVPNPTINDGLPADGEFIPQANYWFLMNGALESSLNFSPSSPKIVKDASNNYYVAFYDPSSGAVVKRWNPNTQTWVQLGSAVDSNASNSGAPTLSIAVDNSGNPVVAYIKSQSGYNRLFVKRWDSTSSTWQAVGSVINPNVTQWASYPSLALDSAGNPLVAFVQTTSGGGNGLFVRQWDGSIWNTVGTGILDIVATNTILYPSLAVYDNRPIVSWHESNNNMFEVESSNRLAIWQFAWSLFLEHPWQGVDAATFKLLSLESGLGVDVGGVKHAHNLWLTFASTYGIFGLAASLVLTFGLAYVAWRSGKWHGIALLFPIFFMNIFDVSLIYVGVIAPLLLAINSMAYSNDIK